MKEGLRYMAVEDSRTRSMVIIQMDGGGVQAAIEKGDSAEMVANKLIELAHYLKKTVVDRETPVSEGEVNNE